ncbi:MAG: hypothetical protein U9Q15_01895 [Patescibacteria group bacterium]|nr:hypothetical protein [Patescibacteria group bacterium]
MKLILPTPWYRNSKYVPHLIEHCVLHPKDLSLQDCFLYASDIDASTNGVFTGYHFPYLKEENIEILIDSLLQKISPEVIDYEKFVLEDELDDISYARG